MIISRIFLPAIFISLLLSCAQKEDNNYYGPLVSEVDKKNEEKEKPENHSTSIELNHAPKKDLINNTNVVEKLTSFGLENKETKIKIKTKYGSIKIRLYKDTPLHRANFIMLTKNGYFDSTLFYRVIDNFIVQGGNSDRDDVAVKMSNIGNYKIPDEITSKHIHKRGALAMAVHEQEFVPEAEKDKRSSPYNFYIVQQKPLSEKYMDKLEERYKFKIPESRRKTYHKYGGVPHLDGDFTVFGEVYSGMSVVDKIVTENTDAYDRPLENIFLTVEIIE